MPTPGNAYRQLTGVVVSAGKMMKTVKVRIPGQKWDKHIRKVSYSLRSATPAHSAHLARRISLRLITFSFQTRPNLPGKATSLTCATAGGPRNMFTMS